MKQENYLLEFDDIENQSVTFLKELISKTKGRNLNELFVKNLSYHNGKEITPGEGVYLFREGTQVVYVGKVSSMSFTERIPKHLDFRPYAWMNRLVKIISERKLNHNEPSEQNLKLALGYAFDNLNIILINFKKRDRINRTERLLRSCYPQSLNAFKQLRLKDESIIVGKY